MKNDPDSRMHVRGIGELMHPGCCAVCGNGNCETGYIDLGVFYDYEGQVYLCMTCVNEVADTAGLLTDTEARFLQAQNKDLAESTRKVTEQLEKALERLDHFNSLFGDVFNHHPDVIADSNEPANESTDGELIDGSVTERETDDTVVDQPSEVEGPIDVSRVKPSNIEL